MATYNVIIKTKGAGAAYYVDEVEAPYSIDAIASVIASFSVEKQLKPGKDFNVALVTNAEAAAFDAGTYDPFEAVEAFNAAAAA